jgi:hypothetical protein
MAKRHGVAPARTGAWYAYAVYVARQRHVPACAGAVLLSTQVSELCAHQREREYLAGDNRSIGCALRSDGTYCGLLYKIAQDYYLFLLDNAT